MQQNDRDARLLKQAMHVPQCILDAPQIYLEAFLTLEEWRKNHPRACKLMEGEEVFFVVKASEPYARQVVELIKEHEGDKWTEGDQELAESVLPPQTKRAERQPAPTLSLGEVLERGRRERESAAARARRDAETATPEVREIKCGWCCEAFTMDSVAGHLMVCTVRKALQLRAPIAKAVECVDVDALARSDFAHGAPADLVARSKARLRAELERQGVLCKPEPANHVDEPGDHARGIPSMPELLVQVEGLKPEQAERIRLILIAKARHREKREAGRR